MSTKHLENVIHDNENGTVCDIMEKRAVYINNNNENGMLCDLMEKKAANINNNNELMQEFGFVNLEMLLNVNNIFNTVFYGSVLWDLYVKEVK